MRRYLILCLFVIIAALLPLFVRPYWLHVIIIAYFYALLASSWSLLAGYAGQFSFAHIAFLAIGAYTSGFLGIYLNIPPPISILIGSFIAAAVGLVIGILCLRVSGVYLALFTLAFSEILRVILSTEYEVTRGDLGLHVGLLFSGASKIPYYYTMLGVLIRFLLCLR
jgi:branched-chain amino acid transport system permease protein